MKINLTEANFNALLSATRALLVLLGGYMADKGLESTNAYSDVMMVAGGISALGAGAWGVISALQNVFKRDQAVAAGVQAGINLTVSGSALASDGTTITSIETGATPPRPVTVASSKEIVKDFAPHPDTIAKA